MSLTVPVCGPACPLLAFFSEQAGGSVPLVTCARSVLTDPFPTYLLPCPSYCPAWCHSRQETVAGGWACSTLSLPFPIERLTSWHYCVCVCLERETNVLMSVKAYSILYCILWSPIIPVDDEWQGIYVSMTFWKPSWWQWQTGSSCKPPSPAFSGILDEGSLRGGWLCSLDHSISSSWQTLMMMTWPCFQ